MLKPFANVTMAEAPSWVSVGSSVALDTGEALAEALSQLQLVHPPKLVVVLAAPRYSLARLAELLQGHLPDCPRIGCSTSGEIACHSPLSQSLVLWVLGGTGIEVSTGWGESSEQGLRQAAATAAACLDRLNRRRHTVLLLLSDGLGGDQMDVVRGAYDVAHIDVPLVGGCAGDYLAMRETLQLHGQRVMNGAVVAAAISSERPLGVGVSHGWIPVSEPMLVTKSRGTELNMIDDRPALDVYLDFFNPPSLVRTDPQAFSDFAATHPIGICRRERIEMRLVSGFDPVTRSLQMVAEVPQGALACLTEGNDLSILKAAADSTEAAIQAIGGNSPAGLLVFDCVSRRSALGESRIREETDRIAACSAGIPMAGFYTYGEIARIKGSGGFHNQTLVTLAIG